MSEERTMWGCHLVIEAEVLALSKTPEICCGWAQVGDATELDTLDKIKARYREAYPDDVENRLRMNSGQLNRFRNEMTEGDYVVFSSKSQKKIYVGVVSGPYHYSEDAIVGFPHRRPVKWIKSFPRTAFTQGALYEVGSFLTIFKVKNYRDEFLKAAGEDYDAAALTSLEAEEADETVSATAEDIEQSTKDFVLKQLARCYKGYPLQDVVKDLLEAMGYNAQVGQKGSDGGIDLIAYKDEFPPRIVVQVKSYEYETSSVSIGDVKNLAATLKDGDVGIFVTLGEYSKPAKDYLESVPKIRALTGYDFVGLILKYYDGMPNAFKANVPLKRVFIPTSQD